jgi:hypothetical protein
VLKSPLPPPPPSAYLTHRRLPAPVLLAMEEQPRLRLLAGRCFEQAGDVEEALKLVFSSSGIQRSRYHIFSSRSSPSPPPLAPRPLPLLSRLALPSSEASNAADCVCVCRAMALEHAGAAAEAARALAKMTGNAHACGVLEALSSRVVKRLK